MITRPMLADSVNPKKGQHLDGLRYPLLGSKKLDGLRCLIHPTLGPVSRKFLPIPNRHVNAMLNTERYYGLDGEIMMFDASGKPLPFNPIQSAVMSEGGTPEFEYWVFDKFYSGNQWIDALPFSMRYALLDDWQDHPTIKVIPQHRIYDADDAQKFASRMIAEGWEGIILRDPSGKYKSGRATWKQQGMIKYKEFSDAEGTIIGFEERLHNTNEQQRDEFGLAKRSSHKDGKVPAGTLGKLILHTERWGEVRVAGFDLNFADDVWNNKEKYLGKEVTFSYQEYGMQDLPRFPVFRHIRLD
jgi:ATP-dependent DNA ligase